MIELILHFNGIYRVDNHRHNSNNRRLKNYLYTAKIPNNEDNGGVLF